MNDISFEAKHFNELTGPEVFRIMEVRAKVFVVEQECAYQDPDEDDLISLHMTLKQNDELIAYLRAFESAPGTIRIGRVLTTRRGRGYGAMLMTLALREIRERLQPEKIELNAQTYAVGFYEKHGFKICSELYVEDGIPHVSMLLENR